MEYHVCDGLCRGINKKYERDKFLIYPTRVNLGDGNVRNGEFYY